jgi:hypothetical protein
MEILLARLSCQTLMSPLGESTGIEYRKPNAAKEFEFYCRMEDFCLLDFAPMAVHVGIGR